MGEVGEVWGKCGGCGEAMWGRGRRRGGEGVKWSAPTGFFGVAQVFHRLSTGAKKNPPFFGG